MTTRISHWIDGRPAAGTSGRTSPVFNPATGRQTAEVELAGADDIKLAVASAAAAAKQWRSASLSKRAAVLFAFRELLNERSDELAAIVTAEHGKGHEGSVSWPLETGEKQLFLPFGLSWLLENDFHLLGPFRELLPYELQVPIGGEVDDIVAFLGFDRGANHFCDLVSSLSPVSI